MSGKTSRRILKVVAFTILAVFVAGIVLAADPITIPKVGIEITPSKGPKDVSTTIQILLILTVLTIAPGIILLTTSFTRIIIVLSFLRQALGSQSIPPNQVLLGLALFMTFFLMKPVATQIYEDAWKPYSESKMTFQQAADIGVKPLRQFMFKQTREKDLALFIYLSKTARPKNQDDVPTSVLIPAFIISEMKTAFTVGFLIYIPFLIIDMIVASTLMSMGMLMLPPVMISLPFKLLLFILVDGWHLISRALILSF